MAKGRVAGDGNQGLVKQQYITKNADGTEVLTPFGKYTFTYLIISKNLTSIRDLATSLNVAEETVGKWRESCPQLRDMIMEGRKALIGALADTAADIALNQRDVKMTQWLLERMDPETYAINKKVDLRMDATVVNSELDPEKLEKLKKAIDQDPKLLRTLTNEQS
jgi:hypothetical protein